MHRLAQTLPLQEVVERCGRRVSIYLRLIRYCGKGGDENEDSRRSVNSMRTVNLNPVECPSRHEQHPTNRPLLPTRQPAGVSVTRPIAV